MASRSADFNYKVALASGLKSLQGGRLRQAEEQFRYLVAHFAGAEGGYRGLAKVLVEQEDRPAALRVLLDGGAALAKAQQRTGAIALYREAVALEPADLTAHRRLAAALALGGDNEGAAHEYARYIRRAIDDGQTERAQLEATYAMGRMPHNHEIEEMAKSAGLDVVVHAEEPRHAMQDRDALMKSTFGAMAEAQPHQHDEVPQQWAAPEPIETASSETAAPSGATDDAWTRAAEPLAPAAPAWSTATPSGTDAWDTADATAPAAPAATSASDGETPSAAAAVTGDESTVEAAAAQYLAKGDPRGGDAALEAARRYIADGRIDAASDLLLQLIAAGIANHDAQRLLVEVTKSMGKREVARAKVKLLVEALKLDGRAELAAEVEQLTEAI